MIAARPRLTELAHGALLRGLAPFRFAAGRAGFPDSLSPTFDSGRQRRDTSPVL